MKQTIIVLLIGFFALTLNAQNNEDKSEASAQSKTENTISSSKTTIISTNNIENNFTPTNNNKRHKPEFRAAILKELHELNYSPKEVYFRLVAEELENIYNEKLT